MTIVEKKNEAVLSVEDLKTYYPVYGGFLKRKIAEVKAVDGVSFYLNKGETLALVGESGCGKTTIGNSILNLVPATDGKVFLKNKCIISKGAKTKKKPKNVEQSYLSEVGSYIILGSILLFIINFIQPTQFSMGYFLFGGPILFMSGLIIWILDKKRNKQNIRRMISIYNNEIIGFIYFLIGTGLMIGCSLLFIAFGVEMSTIRFFGIIMAFTPFMVIGLLLIIYGLTNLNNLNSFMTKFIIGWICIIYYYYYLANDLFSREIVPITFIDQVLSLITLFSIVFLFIFRQYWKSRFIKILEISIGIFCFTLFASLLYKSGINAIQFFQLSETQEAGFLILFLIAITLFNPMIYIEVYVLTLVWIDNRMKLRGNPYKNPDSYIAIYHKRLMDKNNIYSKDIHKKIQFVFQDPDSSLNPRWKVVNIIGEPLRELLSKRGTKKIRREVLRLLETVSMKNEHLDRYPHEFSGGQKQRIVISRALASNPEVIILDEPTSALDVSVQAQILNLLKNLQKRFDLSFLFITHDLSVVQHIADRVAVMYLGKFVEVGKVDDVFYNPSHPYTKALLSARPTFDPSSRTTRIILKGEIPSPINPPMGCAFHPRCYAQDQHMCDKGEPVKIKISDDHYMWCKPFKKE